MNRSELAALAKLAAARAGFDLCGLAAIPRDSEFSELKYFPEWIAAGYAGEMEYLKSRNEQGELKRSSVHSTAPWARSVIVCALNYDCEAPYSTEACDPNRGWISRYAWSRDYHDILMPKLRQVEQELLAATGSANVTTRCYVDTGPHVERVYAKHAGVGWIGKNTCILNQQHGSWIFLGIILTSLEMATDAPAADRCGTCRRCIDACPTQAIPEAYKLDASRCIAYLTIEKRGEVPPELRDGIGNNIFGCDICQDVCPWNHGAGTNGLSAAPTNAETSRPPYRTAPELAARNELINPALEWLAEMTREDYQRTFKGSPVKRAKFSGLRRNVAVAMGNSGDADFLPALKKMAHDEDAIVAEHARWAIEKLTQK
jgi:epoxyqueuosine reductase